MFLSSSSITSNYLTCRSSVFVIFLSILLHVYTYYSRYNTRWALSTNYEAEGQQPKWSVARWRGLYEHPTNNAFSQWLYVMVTDTETLTTWSIAIGGFRGGDRAGGFMRVKSRLSPYQSKTTFDIPSLTVPFHYLVGNPHTLNVQVYDQSPPSTESIINSDNIIEPILHIEAINDYQVRVKINIHNTSIGNIGKVDLLISRTYGVFAFGTVNYSSFQTKPEDCTVANLPFSYAAKVDGTLQINDWKSNPSSSSSQWRAYLESTWGCTFPQSAGNTDEKEYPWKWLWAIVPESGSYPRGGRVSGEIGLIVSNARMVIQPFLNTTFFDKITISCQGTFAFIDLPNIRIGTANVTLLDNTNYHLPALMTASSNTLGLHHVYMVHSEWVNFEDEYGKALLPMLQILHIETVEYYAIAVYRSEPTHFLRLPVRYTDQDGQNKVVSDFRATFSSAFLRIAAKVNKNSTIEPGRSTITDAPKEAMLPEKYTDILFEGYIPHNAAEFAYHAPFNDEHIV